jgi:hypothetical protein
LSAAITPVTAATLSAATVAASAAATIITITAAATLAATVATPITTATIILAWWIILTWRIVLSWRWGLEVARFHCFAYCFISILEAGNRCGSGCSSAAAVGFLHQNLAAQLHTVLVIDGDDFHLHHVADLDHVFHPAHEPIS